MNGVRTQELEGRMDFGIGISLSSPWSPSCMGPLVTTYVSCRADMILEHQMHQTVAV